MGENLEQNQEELEFQELDMQELKDVVGGVENWDPENLPPGRKKLIEKIGEKNFKRIWCRYCKRRYGGCSQERYWSELVNWVANYNGHPDKLACRSFVPESSWKPSVDFSPNELI